MEMNSILLLVDSEVGHILPTLKLARDLSDFGFEVNFAGPGIGRSFVQKQGFVYHEVFKDVLTMDSKKDGMAGNHYHSILMGGLDDLFERLRPKVVLFSSYMVLEGLILQYMYDGKFVIYCPSFLHGANEKELTISGILVNNSLKSFFDLSGDLPQRILRLASRKMGSINGFKEIFSPIAIMSKIVCCPQELRIGGFLKEANVIYDGPGILEESISDFNLDQILPHDKKLIYVSMGSQIKRYPEKVNKIFGMTLKCMELPELQDFHLFLTLGGSNVSDWGLDQTGENVSTFDWLPQKEVLTKASIAIIHGGLGSIKECIFQGVPMLVVPMGRDQNDNALRVAHHKLGQQLDIDALTINELKEQIVYLTQSKDIQEHMESMEAVFQKKNSTSPGANYIKNLILLPTRYT